MDLEETIKPAINIIHGKTLSTEEFQRLLFDYFEEMGIMSNLRAHLRTQMINVLKETNIGRTILMKKADISPKLQALNLLIAEYLLQRNYHYTLSVLSSEVPLNNAFPPMSLDECMHGEHAFRFADNDMLDILDALGVTKVPDLANQLSTRYKMPGSESLLACILQLMPTLVEKSDTARSECFKSWLSKHDLQSMDLELLIKMFKETGVDIDVILQVIEQLKVVITNEVRRMKEAKDGELLEIRRQVGYEASVKLQKYKAKFASLEAFYKGEKHRQELELQQLREQLKCAPENLQQKYDDVNELNEHIKALERRLKQQEQSLLAKEQLLQQRQELLEMKQKRMDQQFDQLIQQQDRVPPPITNTLPQTASATKQTQMEIAPQHSVEVEAIVEDHRTLKEENAELKKNTANMTNEIALLKGQNCAYQTKIQQLLNRTSALLTQLEKRNEFHQVDTIPSVQVAPDALANSVLTTSCCTMRQKAKMSPFCGSGEEGSSPSMQTPKDLRNFLKSRESRRKKIQRTLLRSSSSENVSPTEDVLKEAKERLLELERESAVIDRHFSTLPKPAPKFQEPANTSGIMQNFQNNMAAIRDRLARMFVEVKPNATAQCTPHSTMSAPAELRRRETPTIQQSTASKNDQEHIGSFEEVIARVNLECGSDFQADANKENENDDYSVAGTSSGAGGGLLINTTISTLDISQLSSTNYDWVADADNL